MSASVPLTAPPSEKRLAAVLEHRFFLRLHMTAILTSTILVGLATTRLLFMLHVNIFAIRYGVAVIAAYAAFVGFVKLWLMYISARSDSNWLDSINFSSGGSSSSSSSSSSSFGSGGGKFGGGGSSGSWEEGSGSSSKAAVAAVPITTQSGTKSKSSSSSGGGGGGSDDLGELILIVLIIALVLSIVITFIWLVWAAPGILSETAFNAALAGVLTRHAQKASNGNWIGSVLKKTALPFALVLVLSIAMGAWAQHYCPNAMRLRDALACVK
jgi:hypothetical protein